MCASQAVVSSVEGDVSDLLDDDDDDYERAAAFNRAPSMRQPAHLERRKSVQLKSGLPDELYDATRIDELKAGRRPRSDKLGQELYDATSVGDAHLTPGARPRRGSVADALYDAVVVSETKMVAPRRKSVVDHSVAPPPRRKSVVDELYDAALVGDAMSAFSSVTKKDSGKEAAERPTVTMMVCDRLRLWWSRTELPSFFTALTTFLTSVVWILRRRSRD